MMGILPSLNKEQLFYLMLTLDGEGTGMNLATQERFTPLPLAGVTAAMGLTHTRRLEGTGGLLLLELGVAGVTVLIRLPQQMGFPAVMEQVVEALVGQLRRAIPAFLVELVEMGIVNLHGLYN